MTYVVRWSSRSLADLKNIRLDAADRITKKVGWFATQDDPFVFAKSLSGSYEDVYRFRVGDYRVLFEIVSGKVRVLMVLQIKHRREAYE